MRVDRHPPIVHDALAARQGVFRPGEDPARAAASGGAGAELQQGAGAPSALDDVDGQAAPGGLLVLVEHVAAGVAHGPDGLVQGDGVAAVAAQGDAGGGDGLDGADGVAPDAGDLDEAADRVAGEAGVVLDADLGGVLDLPGGAAEALGEARGGPGAGGAGLALAADLGAGDGGVLLEQHADRAGGQQEADDAVVVAAGDEAVVVVQDGRNDPGGAVGGGGDDAAARGVLLVDGEREEGDPVHRVERVGGVLRGQPAAQLGRAAPHLQAARQEALAGAAAGDALPHDAPELQQRVVDLPGRPAERLLVLQHQGGHGQARLAAAVQQLTGRVEGVGQD